MKLKLKSKCIQNIDIAYVVSAFTAYESNTTDVVLSSTTMASLPRYRVEDGVMQEGIARVRAIPSFIKDIDIWYQMFIFTAVKGFSGILASTEDNAVGGLVIQNKWVNTNQNVPYVFCVPQSWADNGVKKSFRWPNELVLVDQYNGKAGAYNVGNNGNNFEDWTKNNRKNQWFKSPVNDLTTGF